MNTPKSDIMVTLLHDQGLDENGERQVSPAHWRVTVSERTHANGKYSFRSVYEGQWTADEQCAIEEANHSAYYSVVWPCANLPGGFQSGGVFMTTTDAHKFAASRNITDYTIKLYSLDGRVLLAGVEQ